MDYVKVGSREHRLVMGCMLVGSIISFAIMYSPQPLIKLFADEYHVSPSTASFSISFTTLALGIALLFVPMLSRAWGRKKTMNVSLILTSVFAITSAVFHNFSFFLFMRLLEGVSIAGFPAVAIVYLNEEFHPKDIGKVVGAYVAGTAIGGFTGRVIIGALTDLFSWQIAVMTVGVLCLVGAIWFGFNLPESKNFKTASSSLKVWSLNVLGCFRDWNLIILYAIGFIAMGTYIAILNYIGYPLTRPPYNLSQTVFGFIFVVNLTGTISAFWFGKLADKYPRAQVACLAVTIFIMGALCTLHPWLWVKIAGIMFVAFGFFALHAVASGWIGILAPKKYKAQASSFYLLFYYLGSCLVGWSGGFFLKWDWLGVVAYAIGLATIVFAIAPKITLDKPVLPSAVPVAESQEEYEDGEPVDEEDLNLSSV